MQSSATTVPASDQHSALIIVDVQNCFVTGGTLAVEGGETIIPLINQLASRFANVILTQDWHPSGHISFAANHPGKQPGEFIDTPTARKSSGRFMRFRAVKMRLCMPACRSLMHN